MPCLAPSESRRAQLRASPSLAGGVRVLEPRDPEPAAASRPRPSVPQSRALTSSLLPGSRGSLSHASPRPSAGQPGHGLPEPQAGLAAEQPCLTGLCSLRSASTAGLRPGMGRGLARGPAGWLTTCLLSRGLAAAPVPCSAGPELRRHCSGRRVHPQAVCGSLI